MVRVRKDVYSLTAGAPELDWYGRAIGALKALPRTSPRSWEFMAACHGISSGVPTPPGATTLWRQCQHQTWFFLPWHRGYLVALEAIILAEIEEMGGPNDWALPYWDYSDPGNPRARELPPAFRARNLPDGSTNHLWSPRNAGTPPNPLTLLPSDVGLAALAEPNFTNPPASMNAGFGGPQTGWNHGGGRNGALESMPHNRIHNAIGGLMRDPRTAALDPIFWLHHCNIDRLWEEWRGRVTPPRDPTSASWLSGVKFDFVDSAGGMFTLASGDMLDTTTLRHGYRYDTIPPVAPTARSTGAGVMAAVMSTVNAMTISEPDRRAELVAANVETLRLGGTSVGTTVRFNPDGGRAAMFARKVGPKRHYLSIENVVGDGPARDYRVFVDRPGSTQVPQQVGILTTFGVGEASDRDGSHAGNGISQVIDATDAIERLGPTELEAVRVMFEPIPRGMPEDAPDDFPYRDLLAAGEAELRVGRVNLYTE
jgi:tyrosinase